MIGKYKEEQCYEYETGFDLTSQPYRMGNILAHYELYKKIVEIPGDVIELGVFKGGGIIQFATFRELLENERSRKIIGFDVFGEFPEGKRVESDTRFVKEWNTLFKDDFLTEQDLYESFRLKEIHNVELVKGDICETIREYLDTYPQTRISLLHIDTDIYEPAKAGLEQLFDRVVRGGVVIFDDYATVEGETMAVDEFFADKDYVIRKFPFSHVKPSYIVKK